MTTSTLPSAPPTNASRGAVPVVPAAAAGVPRLRRRRQDVQAELSRCQYLERLVRARVDLLVAHALGSLQDVGHPGTARTDEGVPPTADEVTRLVLDGPARDLAAHLQALTAAGRGLAAHAGRLEQDLDRATEALVQALGADPVAALATGARR